METSENWLQPKRILIILAHPDDPEFFLGATIARWVEAGHDVKYCLLTHGEKGADNPGVNPLALAKQRALEQFSAADVLGVKDVYFLDYVDGELAPSMEVKRDVVRIIRAIKPDILVTCDPTNYFINDLYINHSDHRYTGQIVIDAAFPSAGNPLYFPELLDENYQPHSVKEVWLSLASTPNVALDVTLYWEKKIEAIKQHISQVKNVETMIERQRSRRTQDSSDQSPRYEDRFQRLIIR